MALYLPQRWRQQPQGPVQVDFAHPAGKAAEFVYLASQGAVVRDLVYGEASSVRGNDLLVNGAGRGKLINGSPSSQYVMPRYRPKLAPLLPLTLMAVLTRSTATGSDMNYFMTCSNGSGGYGWRFGVQFYGGSNTDNIVMAGANWNVPSTLNGYSDYPWAMGVTRTLLVTLTPAASSRYDVDLWADGRLIAGAVNSNGDPSVDTDARVRSGSTDSTGSEGCCINMLAAMAGVVPPMLAKDLSLNPWQIFKPRRPVIFSLPSTGPTVPTLSAPGVQSITSTGATPKVTLTF